MISARVKNLQPSPTLTLDAKVKELQAKGMPVVNFTLGEPDFQTPLGIRQAAIRAIEDGFTHYTPSAGIPELRKAIAEKIAADNGITYTANEVIVGVGTKQVLYTAFQTLCQKGDEVLIVTPTWSTYVEQVKLAEATPVFVPLKSPFKLTAKVLEKYITKKTKVLLINSPANPTGATIAAGEFEKIAQLVVERNLFVISDEIYAEILYGSKHTSIASFGEEIRKRTLTVNGFSKAYAMTGWRVGYAAGPLEVIQGMTALCGQTTFGTSSISQKAALAACTTNPAVIERMLREFEKRREFICGEMAKISKVSFVKPEGAFYIFLNVEKLLGKKYKTATEWAQALLENAGVAVVPGEAFYAPGYVRISFATSLPEIKKGIAGIQEFIQGK